MLIDVNLKALAVALVFPVGHFVADTVEIGIAAQVEIADDHATEMAEMADAAFTESQRAEKCDCGHERDNPFHFDGNGNREKVRAAIRKKNSAGDQNAEDGSRSADGGNVRDRASPEMRKRLHDHVENTGANASEKVIAQEAACTPDGFDFAAKHPEHQHIEKEMPDAGDVMEEKVGERLPDAESADDGGRNEPETNQKMIETFDAVEMKDACFEDVNGDVGKEEILHAARDVEVETDAVALDSGARRHARPPQWPEDASVRRAGR